MTTRQRENALTVVNQNRLLSLNIINKIQDLISYEGMIDSQNILQCLVDDGVIDQEFMNEIYPPPNFDYDQAADAEIQQVVLEQINRQILLSK